MNCVWVLNGSEWVPSELWMDSVSILDKSWMSSNWVMYEFWMNSKWIPYGFWVDSEWVLNGFCINSLTFPIKLLGCSAGTIIHLSGGKTSRSVAWFWLTLRFPKFHNFEGIPFAVLSKNAMFIFWIVQILNNLRFFKLLEKRIIV